MRRLGLFLTAIAISTLLLSSVAFGLASLSRSFSTTIGSGIVPGSLVSVSANQPGNIELANTANGSRLIGVAIPANESLLALNASSGQAEVAVSGIADVIVSTLGGDIHTGDQIVVSSISGVGMKAGSSMRSIGVAQGTLTNLTTGAAVRSVKDTQGHSTTIHLGSIPVSINIGYTAAQTGDNQGALGPIQSIVSAIAGHNVSILQTILSFVIAIIAIASLMAVVYGAIRGTIVSIGRNPLAGASIYRSLTRVVAIALLIVVIAIAIIYLTLR